MKKSLLTLTLISLLAGCGSDGDDGANGTPGSNGSPGINGSDGKDANTALSFSLVGRAALNASSPEGAAEIVAYHHSSQSIYAINSSSDKPTIEILPITQMDADVLIKDSEGVINNTNLSIQQTITLNDHTAGDANSIAIHQDLLAVAMAADNTGELGHIAFYDISGAAPTFIKNVVAGYLPDMVAFSPDGSKVVVANEGEPKGDYSIDPEGSLSIIDIIDAMPASMATQVSLTSFNDKQASLAASGVVFSNPTGRTINGNVINTTVAMDLEPEYVAFATDSSTAYITAQENNALISLNLSDNSITIKGLGFKDWSNLYFDASDKDGGVNFKKYPGLYGMYQPDTVASYQWQGANFIVTANEGDGREYFFNVADEVACDAAGGLEYDEDDGCLAYSDEKRASKLTLGGELANLGNDDDDIGRLKVSTVMGDADNDGVYEQLYTYGARSFTIWDENGLVVFDSGDSVDRITASIHGEAFNNDEDANEGDTRSDAKGAEPEALALGQVGKKMLAFVGLERMGGVLVFDISNPHNTTFVDYFINRGLVENAAVTGDLAPEGMKFIDAQNSPTGQALLIIGNEISGTVSVWQITQ